MYYCTICESILGTEAFCPSAEARVLSSELSPAVFHTHTGPSAITWGHGGRIFSPQPAVPFQQLSNKASSLAPGKPRGWPPHPESPLCSFVTAFHTATSLGLPSQNFPIFLPESLFFKMLKIVPYMFCLLLSRKIIYYKDELWNLVSQNARGLTGCVVRMGGPIRSPGPALNPGHATLLVTSPGAWMWERAQQCGVIKNRNL